MALGDIAVVTAPSVEEAVIVGLTRLVATRDEVDIEVLDEGSRGFLGIGTREARVRLVHSRRATEGAATQPSAPAPVESSPVVEPLAAAVTAVGTGELPLAGTPPVEPSRPAKAQHQSAPPAKPDAVAETAGRPAYGEEPRSRADAPRVQGDGTTATQGLDREGLARLAEEMVAHMLPGLDIQATVEWVDEDRPTLWISLAGHDADALVGPRARNLHSLQYLIRALLYHQSDGSYNVVVDADGYRKRQRRSLETTARAKADQAVAEGRTVRLRAMPPQERRIVHIVLREDDRVTTESVGKGRDRAVTIVPRSTSEPK